MLYLLVLIVLATASARPIVKTWTYDELNSTLTPCVRVDMCSSYPILVQAFDKIMLALFTEKDIQSVLGATPSPSGSDVWTREEILKALQNTTMDKKFLDHLTDALAQLDETHMNSVPILTAAVDVSTWTLDDLEKARDDPSTDPDLIPYLDSALTQFKEKLEEDKNLETISIVTPVGLLPNASGETLLPAKRFFGTDGKLQFNN